MAAQIGEGRAGLDAGAVREQAARVSDAAREIARVADVGGNITGQGCEAYRERYKGYYERCKRADSPKMRDANPVVYLVPGVGMITFAADKATAASASFIFMTSFCPTARVLAAAR